MHLNSEILVKISSRLADNEDTVVNLAKKTLQEMLFRSLEEVPAQNKHFASLIEILCHIAAINLPALQIIMQDNEIVQVNEKNVSWQLCEMTSLLTDRLTKDIGCNNTMTYALEVVVVLVKLIPQSFDRHLSSYYFLLQNLATSDKIMERLAIMNILHQALKRLENSSSHRGAHDWITWERSKPSMFF